ncbi:unnamed protein product, partial [Discosporangium mesarthrocarpum]
MRRHGRDLAPDIRDGQVDASSFPLLSEAARMDAIQESGEAIFVPSGWHHQVVNLGDDASPPGMTISVSTNWVNGFNLGRVSAFLFSELRLVREAIGHLRESMSDDGDASHGGGSGGGRSWERQCELIMRANSALSLTDF